MTLVYSMPTVKQLPTTRVNNFSFSSSSLLESELKKSVMTIDAIDDKSSSNFKLLLS